MYATNLGAHAALAWSTSERPGHQPRVVVWEADGSPYGRVGYGHPIVARLAASGIATATVPLTQRAPSPEELAAPVHVLSGGATSTRSNRPWVRSARDHLADVLVRALAGEAVVTGICFGAQLIAVTLAGSDAIARSPRGLELGLAEVHPPATGRVDGSGIVVAALHHHHVELAAVAALGGRVVLSNDHTPVQAFTIGPAILGVQFHPELDPAAMRATVGAQRRLIRAHGCAPATGLASIDRLAHRWTTDPFDRFVVQPARAHLATTTSPEPVPAA